MPNNQTILAAAEQLGMASSTYLVLGLLCLTAAAYLHLRRSYELVRRAQQEWRGTVDAIEDIIFAHDENGTILQVNRRLARLVNAEPVALVARPVSEVLPNLRPGQECPYCRQFSADRAQGEDPCFGGRAIVSTSRLTATPKARKGVVHVVRDVTEQLAAEERYRRLFHGLREAVFVTTPEGTILECNDALVTMLGYSSREELMKVNTSELYADTSSGQRDRIKLQMEQAGFVHNHELKLRKRDGTTVIALETSFATRHRDGKLASYQGFLLDITNSKRAEEEIRRKNRELNALNTMAGLTNRTLNVDEVLSAALTQVIELFGADAGSAYTCDRDRKVLTCRAAAGHNQRIREFLSEVSIGSGILQTIEDGHIETVSMDDPTASADIRELLRREGVAAGLGVVLWARGQMAGWVGISWRKPRVFTSEERELMTAVGRQIATSMENARLYEKACLALEDLQHAQEQLLQSEKMSAVGQMISGVAHELNNPLTAILGYTQLLENEPLNDRSRDFMQKIFRQAQRTHRVVQNLLSFARQRKPHKEHVDLRRVLDETLLLRDYDLRVNNIVVERNFAPDLPAVIADQHQLEQVFLNIINNAVDAILEAGKGGKLRVSCSLEHGRVVVQFHDSGPGLADPSRVFDPFYTTKQIGKGTGLGLSICYGIVKEHGGEVVAFNHAEGGAVFQIRLPAARRSAPVVGKPATDDVEHDEEALVNCRVLVVDDEDSVREFEREVLAGAGAEVTAIRNGHDAAEQLRRHSFDVLLFDGKMPGRYNGAELCRWLAEHRPDLLRRVILTVSDAADPEVTACVNSLGIQCLAKPFEVADLLRACRTAIENKSHQLTGA